MEMPFPLEMRDFTGPVIFNNSFKIFLYLRKIKGKIPAGINAHFNK
jgi:hypothetical protein